MPDCKFDKYNNFHILKKDVVLFNYTIEKFVLNLIHVSNVST